MTQDWQSPWAGSDDPGLILTSELPGTLNTLRDLFTGASAPSSPVTNQLWADTTTKTIKQYNGATWDVLGPIGAIWGAVDDSVLQSSISATLTFPSFPAARTKLYILGVYLISDTATAGSVAATTEWQWKLTNVTQALELFSGTVGTGTALGGVGGGELAVDTEYELLADQNNDIAVSDVLQFSATKVGAPTSPIGNLSAALWGYRKGA